MKSTQIKAKIKALEKELAEVQEYEQKLESGSPVALAELLHSKKCHWNHTDGCGWEYESWERPGHARNEYLAQAEKLLADAKAEGISVKILIKVMNMVL